MRKPYLLALLVAVGFAMFAPTGEAAAPPVESWTEWFEQNGPPEAATYEPSASRRSLRHVEVRAEQHHLPQGIGGSYEFSLLYLTEAVFQTSVGSLAQEDLTVTGAAPVIGFCGGPPGVPLSSTTADGCTAPGDVIPGFALNGFPLLEYVAVGSGFFGDLFPLAGPDFFSDDIELVLAPSVHAVGFWIHNPLGPSAPPTACLYTPGPALAGCTALPAGPAPGVPVFAGFSSDLPIVRIEVLDGAPGDENLISRLQLGTGPNGGALNAFVSSVTADGSLGGVAGADAQCQVLASNAGIPGSYKAWIADLWGGPLATFTPGLVPYKLLDGTKIADDFFDLADGTLDAPFNVTDTGVVLAGPSGSNVWTGANAVGTPRDGGALCSDWTSNSSFDRGAQGRVDTTGSNWSFSGASPCDRQRRLYCIEQPTLVGSSPPFVPKTVFVSSTLSDGSLGGVAGADATCNALAAAAFLPGTYKAWLSDSGSTPNTSFSKAGTDYVTPCATLVARGYGPGPFSLTSGSLLSPINCTETGLILGGPSGSKVWTGTDAFGNKLNNATCDDWGSNSMVPRGAQGRTSSAASTWSFSGASPCSQQRRLYCVEQ